MEPARFRYQIQDFLTLIFCISQRICVMLQDGKSSPRSVVDDALKVSA